MLVPSPFTMTSLRSMACCPWTRDLQRTHCVCARLCREDDRSRHIREQLSRKVGLLCKPIVLRSAAIVNLFTIQSLIVPPHAVEKAGNCRATKAFSADLALRNVPRSARARGPRRPPEERPPESPAPRARAARPRVPDSL